MSHVNYEIVSLAIYTIPLGILVSVHPISDKVSAYLLANGSSIDGVAMHVLSGTHIINPK